MYAIEYMQHVVRKLSRQSIISVYIIIAYNHKFYFKTATYFSVLMILIMKIKLNHYFLSFLFGTECNCMLFLIIHILYIFLPLFIAFLLYY